MQVTMRELRNHTRAAVDAALRGEDVVIMRRDTPVLRLVPIGEPTTARAELEDWLDELLAEEPYDSGLAEYVTESRLADNEADDRRNTLA
jgi:antitoxin (DNA-binding transcriptional repressor) of toxin-antitoxin stability system